MGKDNFKVILNAKEKSADIWIYEDIGDYFFGGLSAKSFADEIKKIGDVDTINIFLNSPGGDVFDGVAIYSILKRNKANVIVEIDGLAASIASVIAMAGDEIRMSENAMMMIHNPWGVVSGDATDMRKFADEMDKIRDASIMPAYRRTGMDDKELSDMMDAETWMSATEALEMGFIDEISAEKRMAAKVIDLKKYKFKNTPETLKKEKKPDGKDDKGKVIDLQTPSIDKWSKRIAAR